MPIEDIWSPKIVCHDRHNHRETDSSIQVENLHIQIISVDHNTGRVYHLIKIN